jgi:hypothetical protein
MKEGVFQDRHSNPRGGKRPLLKNGDDGDVDERPVLKTSAPFQSRTCQALGARIRMAKCRGLGDDDVIGGCDCGAVPGTTLRHWPMSTATASPTGAPASPAATSSSPPPSTRHQSCRRAVPIRVRRPRRCGRRTHISHAARGAGRHQAWGVSAIQISELLARERFYTVHNQRYLLQDFQGLPTCLMVFE